MAVTLPTAFPAIDPDSFRPNVHIVSDPQAVNLIESANWLFANAREGVCIVDFLGGAIDGNGLFQGVGSPISTTADGATYVHRASCYYRARNIPTNNNQLHLVVYAAAAGNTGGVRVRVYDAGASLIDTLTVSITTAGSPGVFTVTATGGALDGGTEYHCQIELMAAAGGAGTLKLYQLGLFETVYTSAGALP
jgi:hypothetical protein